MRPFHVAADIEAADAGGLLCRRDTVVAQVDALAVQFNLVVLRDRLLLLVGVGERFLCGVLALARRLDAGLILACSGFFFIALGSLDGAFGGFALLLDGVPRLIQLNDLDRKSVV